MPSVLTPSSRQFAIVIGALPQTPPPFLSWHKKGGKKGQDCGRFARKMVVRKAQIVQLVEVRSSFYKSERAWHELQLRTGTIFNRLPRLFFGSPAEVEDQEVIIINQWINILTDSRFLKTFSLNSFSLCSFYCLQQWTIDNWQQISRLLLPIAYCLLPLRFPFAVSDSLKSFSLNSFSLCSFYCLLPIAYGGFRLP